MESVTKVFKYIATGPSLNLKDVLIFTSTFVLSADIHLPFTSFRNSRHDLRIVLLPHCIIITIIMMTVISVTPSTGVVCSVSRIFHNRFKCPFSRRKNMER